ncbi:hypothetical protein FRC02_010138 [Tulasnella sp. 418]|nr:hypothetical protein FRC02_010138 [Tulasnella sp. 418]
MAHVPALARVRLGATRPPPLPLSKDADRTLRLFYQMSEGKMIHIEIKDPNTGAQFRMQLINPKVYRGFYLLKTVRTIGAPPIGAALLSRVTTRTYGNEGMDKPSFRDCRVPPLFVPNRLLPALHPGLSMGHLQPSERGN